MKKVISLLSLCTALVLGACGSGGDDLEPEALLAPIAELSLAGENAKITWPSVEHAKAYYYELTKDGVEDKVGQVQLATYNFKLERTSLYTFRVKALADKTGMWLDSDWSTTITVQLSELPTPAVSLAIEGDVAMVSWPAVEYAKAYYHELTKDGVMANSGQVQLTTYNFKLVGTSKYTFRVKALADEESVWLDSEWSPTLSAQLSQLSSPVARVDAASVTNTSAVVRWNSIENAVAYHYQLCEGESIVREGDVNGLEETLSDLKENATYTFRVMALASGDYVDSNYSSDVSFTTYQLVKLSKPSELTAKISGIQATLSWRAVDGAVSYDYEVYKGTEDNAMLIGNVATTTVELNSLELDTYRFRVKALSKADDIWVQDSEFSDEYSFTIELVKLDTPTNVTAGTSGNLAVLTWKPVDGAASYSYELYQGSAQSALKSGSVTTATVALTSLQPGSYRFRVKAVGKAEDVWVQESEFSADYTFTIDGQAVNLALPNHEIDGVIRAFPGAEGGGMYTTGGRGGRVIHVTNLNDSGSGSLREAINTSGARTIVFDVCGTIQLKSTLEIKNSDVTIAGQTAPGEGITLRDYSVVVKANNVIIRYMRFRMGDAAKQENDAIWGRYYENIILDHCSMSWSTDECASFYANKNFTMQWCLVGESLRKSVHGKGDHGYGGIWGGKNASFHHNMLTCHDSRNARIDHPQIYDNYLSTHRGNVDYRNNLINNWGSEVTYGGESGWFNIIGNYYKKGPASTNRAYFVNAYADYTKDGKVYSDAYGQFYIDGNVNPDQATITADNKKGINWKNGSNWGNYNQYLSAPLPIRKDDVVSCFTSTHTAVDAYARILDCAGASLKRDAVDKRLVDDARNGKATYTNGGNGSKNGIIDTQTAVGGWPTLSATSEEVARATTDTDKDNIPDYYEGLLGLDPTKADATTKTLDPQGLYTNFEIYLHYLVKDITANQTAGGSYTKLE